jgi:transcriptional regulator with XRE-family HTH domain
MKDMSAFATYVTVLRERQGYTRDALAKKSRISAMSIGRIEDEGQEPKAKALARLVEALKADWKDVHRFLLHPELPASEGRYAAYVRYAQIEAGLTDEERLPLTAAEALERADRMRVADDLRREADNYDRSSRSAK